MSATIVFTGPESSGKSTLASRLATHLSCPLVSEQARPYFANRADTNYLPSDILQIAQLQSGAECLTWDSSTSDFLVVDTDYQVLRIWWQVRFGPAPWQLQQQSVPPGPRIYVACQPDLAWQADPLRENPQDRDMLFVRYLQDLKDRQMQHVVVAGSGDERWRHCVEQLTPWLRNPG